MNPQDPYNQPQNVEPHPLEDTGPNIKNPLATMQPGERNICEVKRHPFGMLGMYISTGVMIVVLAVLAFIVAPRVISPDNRAEAETAGAAIFIAVAVLTLLFVFISHIIYWGNRWILTSDSLTQVRQTSLFDKQHSQLSLGNLEDVSAEQHGLLAQMFNFGTLRVETAGERTKFLLTFCPDPNKYAQQILAAREAFEQGRRVAPFGNQDLNHYATPMYDRSTPTPPSTATYQVPLDDDDQQQNG